MTTCSESGSTGWRQSREAGVEPSRRLAGGRSFVVALGLSFAMLGLAGSARADLKVGDQAPDFTLTDQNGATVHLADFRHKQTVVLAFYIRAFTPTWTKELKAYQSDLAKFQEQGAQIIGISVDSAARNKAFAAQLGLKFPVLSDEQKTVSAAYGVLFPVIHLAKRTTFVIDKQGVIRDIQTGGEAADPDRALPVCSLVNPKQ